MTLETGESPRRERVLTDYRLYFLDTHNHIRRRIDLECRDDAHAIALVREHEPHGRVELWQGRRLVQRFEAFSG